MPPSASTELTPEQQRLLLTLAREAINAQLRERPPPASAYEESALTQHRGVFVTLKKAGQLRGCIGVIESQVPLVESTIDCAHGAAFRDPRFPPLVQTEIEQVQISISVLSRPEPMQVRDRAHLLTQLRPGLDGLILAEGARRATFLPQVWEQLPDKGDFVAQLLQKAGLALDHWSPAMQASRYQSVSFTEPAPHSPETARPV